MMSLYLGTKDVLVYIHAEKTIPWRHFFSYKRLSREVGKPRVRKLEKDIEFFRAKRPGINLLEEIIFFLGKRTQ